MTCTDLTLLLTALANLLAAMASLITKIFRMLKNTPP